MQDYIMKERECDVLKMLQESLMLDADDGGGEV